MLAEEREFDFRTGDRVNETGEYRCEAGECQTIEAGEVFATCPETGRDTGWRREDRRA